MDKKVKTETCFQLQPQEGANRSSIHREVHLAQAENTIGKGFRKGADPGMPKLSILNLLWQ
ncbi:translocase of outer membrane 7 isoform X1 [Megachile rotundata]|uniref:translocase of outer membrane 7 isoform X1 n=1 Tax=Megachile rotundata TaxID=143995 RepID=UPI003FD08003